MEIPSWHINGMFSAVYLMTSVWIVIRPAYHGYSVSSALYILLLGGENDYHV